MGQYDIFLNDERKYKGKSKLFSWLSKITVYDLYKNEICTVVKDLDFSNYLNYRLEFENGFSKIQSESFIEYYIRNSKGTLSFCLQKGNLIGVFLNDKQVGTIIKNRWKILGRDKYVIQYEKGEVDHLTLIGFAIAYDMESNNELTGIVSWNFGNLAINPVKYVDPKWKPLE